jgi:peptidyl-prolyl cis-trans isomerase SurA
LRLIAWALTAVGLLAMMLAASPVAGQRLDGIAAVVNDDVVLQSDVEEQLYLFLLRSQQRPDSSVIDTLRRQILDQLIDEKLIVLEAEAQGISVGDQEVEKQVNSAIEEARQRMGNEAAFREQLARENMTEAQLRQKYQREVRRQLLAQRLVQRQVPQQQPVGAAEAEAYFKEFPDQFPLVPPEARVSVIQISVTATQERRDEALARATAARTRIQKGEKFARVAADVSEDPGSANSGGDLGFFGRGVMDPAFESAAFSLKLGQLSEPIESPFGFHVIETLEYDTLKTVAGNDSIDVTGQQAIDIHARHILIRVQLQEADATRARELALEVHGKAEAGADFGELARQYSNFQGPARADGDLGFISMATLQPHIRAGIDSIPIGGITDPLPTQAGFNIFKVTERRAERAYTLEEIRGDLPQIVGQIKQRERYETWVENLRKKSHIEIRDS